MNENEVTVSRRDDLHISTVLACGVIILGFVVYWAAQILSAWGMLELAYG